MFVGHYSVSFLAKSLEKTIPLWVLFLAVQFVDILWATFVIFDIEKVRIIPNFTKSNDLDLYFMPYTHSLIGALGWSVLAFGLYFFWRRGNPTRPVAAALLVGFAIFSHWILDLIVHTPDLSLYDDTYKMGFGLWNLPQIAFPLELLLLGGGLWLYLRSTKAASASGRYGMLIFVIFLMIAQLYALFGPAPETTGSFSITALVFYFGFSGIAFWLERYRN
ncbi:MAG: hypothetical protein ABJA66_06190 [Actinomycetota bacterium]